MAEVLGRLQLLEALDLWSAIAVVVWHLMMPLTKG